MVAELAAGGGPASCVEDAQAACRLALADCSGWSTPKMRKQLIDKGIDKGC